MESDGFVFILIILSSFIDKTASFSPGWCIVSGIVYMQELMAEKERRLGREGVILRIVFTPTNSFFFRDGR